MTDPFAQDAARREALERELIGIRIALAEAHEHRSPEEALEALDMAFALVDATDGYVRLLSAPEEVRAMVLPEGGRRMQAQYAGRCTKCGGPVRVGEQIHFYRVDKSVVCARCLGARELEAGL